MLPSSEANRLKTMLPPNAPDAQIAAAALGFLPAEVQDRYAIPGAANNAAAATAAIIANFFMVVSSFSSGPSAR